MRQRRAIPVLTATLGAYAWMMTAPSGFATILDRIAASVGPHVITESEVIRDLRVAAFLDQEPADLSGGEKRKAAGRLVDQYLILHDAELNHVTLPSDSDAVRLLDRTKSQYPSEAAYRAALEHYGITEEDLRNHLLAGLRTLRYTDFRFRPEVQLSEEEMRGYYDRLVAQRERTDTSPVPTFAESRDRVQALMTDERVMQALDRWLTVVREENHVRFWDAAFQ